MSVVVLRSPLLKNRVLSAALTLFHRMSAASVASVTAGEVVLNRATKDYEYRFTIRFGGQAWQIQKSFEDFVQFNKLLCKRYGDENVPFCPSKSLLEFFGSAQKKAEKRQLGFEGYLLELLVRQEEWPCKRIKFSNVVPPTASSTLTSRGAPSAGGTAVLMSTELVQFLDFDNGYVPPTEPLASTANFLAAGAQSSGSLSGSSGGNAAVVSFRGPLAADGTDLSPPATSPAIAHAELFAENQSIVNAHEAELTEAERFFLLRERQEKLKRDTLSSNTPQKARTRSNSLVAGDDATPPAGNSPRKGAAPTAATAAALDATADGFVLVEETETMKRERHEAVVFGCATMTSQMTILVRDFTILADRIDYVIFVSLFGNGWTISKRYSELEAFHNELLAFYGASAGMELPSLDPSKVPVWRKTDSDTGRLRQAFFTEYLKSVAAKIDSWEPREFIMSLPFTGPNGATTEACINGHFFNFLDFAAHVDEFVADVAVAAVEQRKTALPQDVLVAIQTARTEDQRANMRRNFEVRRRRLSLLRSDEVAAFCDMLSHFDDDRDAIALVDRFVETGYFLSACQPRLPPLAALIAAPAAVAASLRNLSMAPSTRRLAQDDPSSSPHLYFGVTSEQLAQISRSLVFNDTRILVIKKLAHVLLDDYDLGDVLSTLYYEWDATEVLILDEAGGRLEG